MSHILTSLIVLPLICAAITYFSGRSESHGAVAARWVALLSTLAIFALSLTLLIGFDGSSADFQFTEKAPWFAGYDSPFAHAPTAAPPHG
jgi:NADH-quinone oxidoreductase subunit M